MGALIKSIAEGSAASKKGISAGDMLISINGREITDVLDYKFYGYDKNITLEILDKSGKTKNVRIRKGEGEDPGLEFETYLMDKMRYCVNKCIFCFVDQMPKGMRDTLYIKDDDDRLSFLMGNYITLTNLKDSEIDRLIQLRMSPINVSVHATDPELRARLLGIPKAAKGYETMKKLAAAGIEMNCQIVICPGINDGAALEKTVRDLAKLWPQVPSVSAVPVGLTKHREGLCHIEPYNRQTALETVALVNSLGDEYEKELGCRFVYCADEFFLKAGLEIPPEDYYDGYPQLENGVGLMRLLQSELEFEVKNSEKLETPQPFSIATGVSAAPYIKKLIETVQQACKSELCANVYAIENDFFGKTIDVAGLVTGKDLIAQLKGKPLGKRLLIPGVMLRYGGDVFLDDVTIPDVERELGVSVRAVENDGAELLRALFDL